MDTDNKIHSDNICCACLSEDDNLIDLKNSFLLDVFSSIINVNPLDSSSDIKYLSCWRCRGLLGKYNKFIKQVNQSYTLLLNYRKKKLALIDIKREPTISTSKQYNLDISQSIDHIPFEIKTEKEDIVKINDLEDNFASDFEENTTEDIPEIEDKHANGLIEKKTKVKLEKNKITKNKNQSVVIDKTKKKKKKKALWGTVRMTDKQIMEERFKMSLKSLYVDALFKCEGCLEVFANCDDYKQHLKIKHDETRNHKCKICTKTFNNTAILNQHINKHRSRYVCMVCDKLFKSMSQVLNHREMEHYDTSVGVGRGPTPNPSASPLTCEVCNKTFIWKSSLRKHMEKHTIEAGYKRKPYCETCRLSFTSSASLQKHIKTSSKHEIKLKLRNIEANGVCVVKKTKSIEQTVNDLRATFACKLCDKQFQWRGNLYRHMSSHEAKAQGHLNCAPCNKTFSSLATYQQHMKLSKKHVTENEYKFVCADCGQKFMTKTKLSDHINWEHLKKYSHRCSLCDKIFKSHTSLYIHKQSVHKIGKEHLCDHCGRSFPSAGKLHSHVNALHNRTSQYICSVCNASFNWQSCLSRHRRIVHKEPATQLEINK